MRCWIYFPIRARASRRDCRVREAGVKVIRVRRKISLVVRVHVSLDTRRSEHWEETSRWVRILVRISWDRQRRLIVGLVVAITCAYRWGRGLERLNGRVLLDDMILLSMIRWSVG